MRHPAVRFALLPLLIWTMAAGAVWAVVLPPEQCGDVTPEELRDSADLAAEWIVTNQLRDGRYTYEIDAEAATRSDDYNVVRHAGVTMSLYQVAGRLGDQAAFEAADRGVEWLLANMIERDDWAAPTNGVNAKVGGAALMTIALAERRLLTGDTRYDDVMREVGNFLLAQQRQDGGFYTKWLLASEEMDRVSTSAYYPGEALWALAMLHEAFPGEGWDAAAWRTADFVTLLRDDLENIRYPPLNDHWASYGLAEMAAWGLADHHVEYAREMAGRFSLLIRFEAQKTDDGLTWLLRGGHRRAAALGTWVEGSAALWRLSRTDERMADLEDDLRVRTACGASLLEQRQIRGRPDPLIAGAWYVNGVTRMDDQQHAISGLLYTADALEGRDVREPDPLMPVAQR